MTTVKKYLSLIKFSHTIFAMPFALIGFFLAILYPIREIVVQQGEFVSSVFEFSEGAFKGIALLFALVIGCMIFARSAAMAFNRYLDRHFDARNPRTAIREIPAGILKADSVLLFTIVCSLLFILCTWFI